MGRVWSWLRSISLYFWAILIAVALWFQVHGQGEGSLSMDVPLQVQGLPSDMVIVNDLPDHVRVTINGLQSRLKDLHGEMLFVPLDASGITAPGVMERSLRVGDIRLPVGLRVEKIQPDHVQLQVDRMVVRSVPVRANLELPERWKADKVSIEPAEVQLTGPEVWLDALREVRTNPISLELKQGLFKVQTGVESPSGKAIRLVDGGTKFSVTGLLSYVAPIEVKPASVPALPEQKQPAAVKSEPRAAKPEPKAAEAKPASAEPVPEPVPAEPAEAPTAPNEAAAAPAAAPAAGQGKTDKQENP